VLDRLLPAHLAPRILDAVADHRVEDAVLVRRVAPGEAPFHTAMPVVRVAVLVRHHAHDLVALHLRLERAADAAVGTGREHAVLRLAVIDDRLFDQRRRRAGLHAGAAGDAFGVEEALPHARRDLGIEAAAFDGERERALHLVAGA